MLIHMAGWKSLIKPKHKAETSADMGMVSSHAHTMRRAIPQRMVDSLVVAPTPMMEPVMVCVVDTGMPLCVAMKSVAAPAVSAQNPPTGLSLVIFIPIVLTIRQPPSAVPMAIAT